MPTQSELNFTALLQRNPSLEEKIERIMYDMYMQAYTCTYMTPQLLREQHIFEGALDTDENISECCKYIYSTYRLFCREKNWQSFPKAEIMTIDDLLNIDDYNHYRVHISFNYDDSTRDYPFIIYKGKLYTDENCHSHQQILQRKLNANPLSTNVRELATCPGLEPGPIIFGNAYKDICIIDGFDGFGHEDWTQVDALKRWQKIFYFAMIINDIYRVD